MAAAIDGRYLGGGGPHLVEQPAKLLLNAVEPLELLADRLFAATHRVGD